MTADLTNFVVYFDLSQLPPADFWDNIEDGGGSIRVLKGDLDTEIAREVVSCDKAAQTGEVHARADGTLSAASDTQFWLAYGKDGETDYAVDATYGAEAVWGDEYELASHDGGLTDSTNNGFNGTSVGDPVVVSGEIGAGTQFDGNDRYDISHNDSLNFTNYTASLYVEPDSIGDQGYYLIKASGTDNRPIYIYQYNEDLIAKITTSNDIYTATETNGVQAGGMWVHVVADIANDSLILYRDGGNSVVVSTVGSLITNSSALQVAYNSLNENYFSGMLDELRLRGGAVSSDWVSTEYNNQNDPAAFYSVEDYTAPSGGAPTKKNYIYIGGSSGIVAPKKSNIVYPIL